MTEDPRPLEPWDRRQDESDEAFEAFATYRDLGAQRSQQKAATALAKSRQLLSGWSSKHDWTDRVAAWDLEQDRQRREAMRAENIEAGRRHARQTARYLEVAELFFDEVVRRVEAGELKLAELGKDELLEAIVRLGRAVPRCVVAERLARGMSTENVEVKGALEVARERADQLDEERLAELVGIGR